MPLLRLDNVGRVATMDDSDATLLNATILVDEQAIRYVGPPDGAPTTGTVVERLDCGGRAVLPGLVDCHTHLVFGGDRRDEFSLRTSGISYAEIHRSGGGIQRTVSLTRAESDEALLTAAVQRARRMVRRGVTTIEIKSGYGLDLETECRLLRIARRIPDHVPVRVVTTFLGAHSVPLEHRGDPGRYLDLVVNEMIPAVAAEGLASFCDVFCEAGVFTVDASRRVLEAGRAAGLIPKLHADQLQRTGATRLGIDLGAASVDHLEQIDDADVAAFAGGAGPVAVLLPAAVLFLGERRFPPGRALIDAGAVVALATDMNPGSSMCDDLPLQTTLACTRLGLTPHEALRGITRNAARALRLGGELGAVAVGYRPDLLVLDAMHEEDMPYRFGSVEPFAVVSGGRVVIGPGRSLV